MKYLLLIFLLFPLAAEAKSLPAYPTEKAINAYRVAHHVKPLTPDACLRSFATKRGTEMVKHHYIAHRQADGALWSDGNVCHVQYQGENLIEYLPDAYYQSITSFPQNAVFLWGRSPAHNAVMLDTRFTKIGVIRTGMFVVLEVSS